MEKRMDQMDQSDGNDALVRIKTGRFRERRGNGNGNTRKEPASGHFQVKTGSAATICAKAGLPHHQPPTVSSKAN